MAGSSSSFFPFPLQLFLATLVMTGILFSDDQTMVRAQPGCTGDLQGLMSQCMQYVLKNTPPMDPSASCCDVVKKTNVTCVCSLIPSPVQQMISSQKVTHVLQYCGNPLPPGVECGS